MEQSEIEYILERTFACMQDAKEKILLAVRQRAGFEGWLKLELANSFKEAGAQKVEMEKGYLGGRSDIFFVRNNVENYIEIKPISTGWTVRDESVRGGYTTRITQGYQGVKYDIEGLKKLGKGQIGFALMIMYPYPIEAGTEKERLEAKIRGGVYGLELLEKNPHEIRFLSLNENIGILICLFGPYEED